MDKKLSFKDLAKKVIMEEKRPLTTMEIWDIAKQKGYDKSCNTKGETPWKTINAYIYVDMRDNEKSPFMKYGAMPRRFFLKSLFLNENDKKKVLAAVEKSEEAGAKTNVIKYDEKDLHPLLTYYADAYKLIYTKTINHGKSKKKDYAQWLHPDMVGIWFPEDFNETTLKLAKAVRSIPIKIYSFEIKKQLDFNNIRESFFQAVSNSSWANEGYLVAANIISDDDFYSELERLSSSFGIGIIKLDTVNPDTSEIIFQGKYKTDLDWLTMNKLSDINEDFKEFLEIITKSITINEISNRDTFDTVIRVEDLIKKLKVLSDS
ncbi:MAG: HTH domain-containing protein [Deltaproteobacteria bacterium]|jgi:hypothetical protein|nr:HTH domain-containing protein [Deltaproteobacteria bacterium]MCL5879745.1 HTH domain-containing protein [Deltaproteobacteria bacterium]MDA8304174.1 HTH domain-containing protein [Deltaproteobacteria bacterium]